VLGKKPKLVSISLRLSAEIAAAIDEEVAKIVEENPGLAVTRTDAIRMAVLSWLKERGNTRVR
jgi:hypothetical protein